MAPSLRLILAKSGARILEVPPAEDFAQIRAVTRMVAQAVGLGAAVAYLTGIGMNAIALHRTDDRIIEMRANEINIMQLGCRWNGHSRTHHTSAQNYNPCHKL
ncbi:MAG: hypothetical protein EBU34_11045 [Alphaproteobacteria bacterium]|nr:hypothetical protein [Alphaproteobacteria bacterium]